MTSMTTLEDIVARIGMRMDSLAETVVETRKEWAESRKEWAESRKEWAATEKKLAETAAETRKEWAETRKEWAESRKEWAESRKEWAESRKEWAATEKKLAETVAETRKEWAECDRRLTESQESLSKSLDYWVGRYGDKIGYLIEKILIPGIRPIMNGYGHDFTRLGPDREFYLGKRRFAEVDLYLENCDEAMAVEVKLHLHKDDVEYHLKRLKLLRENEAVSGLKGRTLYSAMAGLDIDDDARDMALNLGMYVIDMVEDAKHVKVIKPPAGVKKW